MRALPLASSASAIWPLRHVHLGQGGPGEQVVRAQGGGHEAGSDGFLVGPVFSKAMPRACQPSKKSGVEFDAAAVFGDGGLEVADGEIAIGVVER